ncbi:MAG TPA: glycosyl transferase, partial [Candidatus Syntrophosphaera sp.]|nr:glycosyl transferase [Candidatus Syntrophosphaera sp.]
MRILLISYYFPPCGGAAVQRWHKWLPVLVESGIEVTVLTTASGDYPVLDPSLEQEIPPQVKVLRSGAPSTAKLWKALFGKRSSVPYGDLSTNAKTGFLRKALIWARLNLIIPDARKFWNPSALKTATAFLKTNLVDAVITTGPPHSTHLIGLELKKRH